MRLVAAFSLVATVVALAPGLTFAAEDPSLSHQVSQSLAFFHGERVGEAGTVPAHNSGVMQGVRRAGADGSGLRTADQPAVTMRVSFGYANHYLHFGLVGFDANIHLLPQLSLDLGFDLWGVNLVEDRDDGQLVRSSRQVPNVRIGASYRFHSHPVVQPFAGGEVGAVLYAQKVNGLTGLRSPVVALALAANAGFDFMVNKHFGAFAALKLGVAFTGDSELDGVPDVQQYVNSTWSPVRAVVNLRVGVAFRF